MAKKVVLYQPEDQDHAIALSGLPLASFRHRFWAFAIDFLIMALVFMTLIAVSAPLLYKWGWADPGENVNLAFGFDNWYSVILIVVYFSLSHFFGNGQTVGKRLLKLRVLSLKHDRLGFWHCVERALGYGASALEVGLGFLQVIWKKDRRATHDRIAETIVVSERLSDRESSAKLRNETARNETAPE